MTTRTNIQETIEADHAMYDALNLRSRVEWVRQFVEGGWDERNSRTGTILAAWDAHCTEAGHKPASVGGDATYASTFEQTGAICRVPGCDWYCTV